MAATAGQVAGKLRAYGKAIPETNKSALKDSAKAVRVSVEALARPATGGDLRFSGAGKGTVGVRDRMMGADAVEVRAIGPMHWLERGVKPHDILPGARRGALRGITGFSFTSGQFGPTLGAVDAFGGGSFAASTRGAGVVLKFPGAGRKGKNSGYSRYARKAGGFPALGVWSKGVDASQVPIRTVWRTRHTKTLGSFFGG